MAYNDKKILKVIAREIERLPEKCPGYQEEMMLLLAEVLTYEHEHSIARMNIVQKISDQVNNVGQFLYNARSKKA
mgnify:CR=1 FL=1